MKNNHFFKQLSFSGLLVTLGIVYGDIGTSPLYVVEAIFNNIIVPDREILVGSASCIFWTLTLQTTVKYILITLRASNKGEGGIFALYALIRKNKKWAYIIALAGGSTLLADGIITPAITVTSAVEGLRILNPKIPVILIAVVILSALFFIQQFGTEVLGKSFGPLMLTWFLTIGTLGLLQVGQNADILNALNPLFAIQLVGSHPEALLILGAVFLATTGAEALYSDLGHCGLKNIRISWIFVKTCLVLSYFGQTAWLINNLGNLKEGVNPFYAIMPGWFLLPGIILATIAAIIASQAMISGSFTLIGEAISLNLWPKMTIKYPSDIKGQLYLPAINTLLWISSTGVILLFGTSSAMEAAYGLSICITMMMTSVLLSLYFQRVRVKKGLIFLIVAFFLSVEGLFFLANLKKFTHGGWFTMIIAICSSVMMYAWYNGREIKNGLMKYVSLKELTDILLKVRDDLSIPKFATNLVYLTKTAKENEIEATISYSLFQKQPKRADIYWFIHIETLDEPYTSEYEVIPLAPGKILKVNISLGFKVEQKINLFLKSIRQDLSKNNEIEVPSQYPSLKDLPIRGDCRYILIDRILTADHTFNVKERLIMGLSNFIKYMAIPESKSYHIDSSNFVVEKVPLGTPDKLNIPLKRRLMKTPNR